jgi:hypothetical protein
VSMKIFQILILLICFYFLPKHSWSQDKSKDESNVHWICPESVQKLETSTRKPTLQNGYRLQIFLGSLDAAKKYRQEFIVKHPNTQVYLSQNIPDYVLRYGNFLSRNDAREALKELRKEIPSAFIVDDMVEPPRIDFKD